MEIEGCELCRLIEAVESLGHSADEIVDLIRYIATGDEQYMPKSKK